MVNNNSYACPVCRAPLEGSGTILSCGSCRKEYPIDGGIPLLFYQPEGTGSGTGVTTKVKSFYEETPFPDYDGFETLADLVQRAQRSVFARLLNEQLPFNVHILEAGCGTGQLSNYLGSAQRFVTGTDMSLNSLRLAQAFKDKHDLNRVRFCQMNLFHPVFPEESFFAVISNGVLHHTADPYRGFRTLARLVQRGGYIIIGLYNTYGRLTTDIRRVLFRMSNGLRFLDPHLRRKDIGGTKKNAWFQDQYMNPHESKHTFDEALMWFHETGFEFMNSIPAMKPGVPFSEREQLFTSHDPGTHLERLGAQLSMIPSGSREGGFFIMIGRRI